MKNKIIYRIIIIGVLCIVIIGLLVRFTLFDNYRLLCQLAENFDEPSIPYYYFLERVYKISESNDIGNEILIKLTNYEDQYLHDCYIRILGVIGKHASLQYLESISNTTIKEKNFPLLFYSIPSIGLLGDEKAIPFLENYLEKNIDDLQSNFLDYTTVSSLYLLTGRDNFYFINSAGEKQRLIINERLSNARKIIVESKGRKRTYEEMITLDKIFRHPDY